MQENLYAVWLGEDALARGECVLYEMLGWLGQDTAFARVRILHSTVEGTRYRAGRIGIVRGERLIPQRPARSGSTQVA